MTLRHAEVLDERGELYTANLRDAAATDPRPLGLPLLGIELLAPSPSGRGSSIPTAKAA